MKKVSEFGYPKKQGIYWCYFENDVLCNNKFDSSSIKEPLLCRYDGFQFFQIDDYMNTPLRYNLTSYKSIPKPKIK